MARKSIKNDLAELKNDIAQFVSSVRNRRTVEHSSTPAVVTKDGMRGQGTVQINELISVVKTARALGKVVILEATETNLVVNLVDRYPEVPYMWYVYNGKEGK